MLKEADPPLVQLWRQRNGRWLLITGSDGRTITAMVWRKSNKSTY